jgi:hypothetical protein
MPSTQEILLGLSSVANQWRHVAIAWHAAVGAWLLAILGGWRPSTRVTAYVLVSPLVSVMIAAFASGNVVNGMMFGVLSFVLGSSAGRFSREPIRMTSPVIAIPAVLLIAFGWGYPHFLETDQWTEYAYAAPLGLLPCPTLSAVTGLSMVCSEFRSRVWAFTLAAAGVLYGAIGVFVLGVTLDYVLLAGAIAAVGTFAMSIHHKALAHGRHNRFDRVAQ